MHKQQRSLVGSILTILFTVLLVILLVYCTTARVKGEVPTVFGFTVMRITTGSMEPTIPTGTYILVQKTPIEKIHVYDIISFYSTDSNIYGALNTHRVLGIGGTEGALSLQTKGDANPVADADPVDGAHLFGRYVCKLRILTFVSNLFMEKGGMVVLLGAQVLLFGAMVMKAVKKKAGTEDKPADSSEPPDPTKN